MFESITTGFIIILIGIAAGLGVDIALKRVFGLEQPAEEDASRRFPESPTSFPTLSPGSLPSRAP